MSLEDIKKFIELCRAGKSTSKERYEIILKHKEKVEQQFIEMQKRGEELEEKTNYYKSLMDKEDIDF